MNKFKAGDEVMVINDNCQLESGTVREYTLNQDTGEYAYLVTTGSGTSLYNEWSVYPFSVLEAFFTMSNNSSEDNQDAKKDAGKPRLTLVPRKIIWDIAAVRMFAVSQKYKDPDNWKKVSPQRFKDAAMRHFLKYLDDPKSLDEESGLNHLWHMACNIAFLCELEDKDE